MRTIKFRQSADEPEYEYILNEQPIALNDYYYNRDLGSYCAVQQALHKEQLTYQYPVIVSTTNPKYKSIFKTLQ